jgi:hypothetical protein
MFNGSGRNQEPEKSHVQIGAIPAKQSEALHLTQTISRKQNQREMALTIRFREHCAHIIHSLSNSMDPIKLYNPNLHKCHDDYHRTETNGKTYITI